MRPQRIFLFGLFLAAAAARCCRAVEPAQVEQWGIFELALNGPSRGNPFTEVRLTGTFSQGSRAVKASGFYDGDGAYRIRFMPDAQGAWTWLTASNAPELDGLRGSFTAGPPSPGNHGPVRVRHTYHFAYADGTPYRPIGTTCYTWIHRPEWIQEETLATLAGSPFNKLRMCVFPQDHATDFMPPAIFPFAGSPPRSWDVTRFNPEFFRLLEKRVGQLRDLGIECDLILFHPYGTTWGFDALGAEADDRYVRYVVARLAAYRNIWWSLANEFDAVRTKTETDWDRLFQLVQAEDPYGRLRSIHNQHLVYNNNQPWVTHASMQDGPAVEDPLRAVQLRQAYRKPVIYDEVQYEGDSPYRWAQLSGRELVHRFWCGTVAGTYVGHSEYFVAPHDVVWLGEGGVLKGQSEPRIAFLKRILDDSPPEGIDPIDPWQDDPFGGQPGRYYLLYFGHQTPASWRFEIPARGAGAGMRFKMDVIDTWNMTITPVPGFFVTEKEGAYHFTDQAHRSIALPGTEGIALRIIRAGDAAQASAAVN
ncbi:MAG: DUF5060 domain-containing protein [Opitutaceae bacterium]